MAFWRRCVVEALEAVLAHRTPPSFEPFEEYNRRVFRNAADWPWPKVQEVSLGLTPIWSPLSSGSPTTTRSFGRFDSIPEGESLYTWYWVTATSIPGTIWRSIISTGVTSAHATELYERWTERVVAMAAPDPITGYRSLQSGLLLRHSCSGREGRGGVAGGATAGAASARSGRGAIRTCWPSAPVALFYRGWDGYQRQMEQALAPLSAEQLAWSAAPHLRSVGLIVRHVVGARARWLDHTLGEGGDDLQSLGAWDDDDQPERSAAELVNGFVGLVTSSPPGWSAGRQVIWRPPSPIQS